MINKFNSYKEVNTQIMEYSKESIIDLITNNIFNVDYNECISISYKNLEEEYSHINYYMSSLTNVYPSFVRYMNEIEGIINYIKNNNYGSFSINRTDLKKLLNDETPEFFL